MLEVEVELVVEVGMEVRIGMRVSVDDVRVRDAMVVRLLVWLKVDLMVGFEGILWIWLRDFGRYLWVSLVVEGM